MFVKGEVMEMAGEEQVVTSTGGLATVDLAASGDAKQIQPGMVELIHVLPNGEQILVTPSVGESVVRQLSGGEQAVEMYTEDVVQQETVVSSANALQCGGGGGGEPQTVCRGVRRRVHPDAARGRGVGGAGRVTTPVPRLNERVYFGCSHGRTVTIQYNQTSGRVLSESGVGQLTGRGMMPTDMTYGVSTFKIHCRRQDIIPMSCAGR